MGEDKVIDVIDVHTQETIVMNVKEFCQAFETPYEDRTATLNCLSLEVSDLALGQSSYGCGSFMLINSIFRLSHSGVASRKDFFPPELFAFFVKICKMLCLFLLFFFSIVAPSNI